MLSNQVAKIIGGIRMSTDHKLTDEQIQLREKMITEAYDCQHDNDLFNKKLKEIKCFVDKCEDEAIAKANLRALQDDNHFVPEFIQSNNTVTFENGGHITKEQHTESLFINKNEKFADRIKVSEEDKEIFGHEGALGELIRGVVTGKWKNKAMKNAVTTTTSGVLIPNILSSQIIDLARNISLFTSANVPIIPMETDNMKISRVKSDPIFKFKKEGEAATESNIELDDVNLKAKTCYGYAYVTLESIKSSKNLEDVIRNTFAQSIAQGIDKAFLYGQYDETSSTYDDFAPVGILNDEDINSIIATANSGYDDIIKAIGTVKKANGNPTAFGYNSETEELLSLLKTTEGQYLEAPKSVQNLNHIVSNQLAYDSSNGSDALVFDPKALLIGIQENIQIKIIEDEKCLKNGLVGFQIFTMQDCSTVYPKHICKITGIK
ncbi:MAG: phage major capsid protein [Clostridium sp.]